MSPKSSDAASAAYCYYLVPNLRALDPSARELDLDAHAWVQPTIIDDEDLTFGGKSLSTWYEEERRRLSSGSGSDDDTRQPEGQASGRADEESRGRERTRKHRHHHHHHHHHAHHHSHQHNGDRVGQAHPHK